MRGSGTVCHRGFLSVPKIPSSRGKIKRPAGKAVGLGEKRRKYASRKTERVAAERESGLGMPVLGR